MQFKLICAVELTKKIPFLFGNLNTYSIDGHDYTDEIVDQLYNL